jgi:hypothetical protein
LAFASNPVVVGIPAIAGGLCTIAGVDFTAGIRFFACIAVSAGVHTAVTETMLLDPPHFCSVSLLLIFVLLLTSLMLLVPRLLSFYCNLCFCCRPCCR